MLVLDANILIRAVLGRRVRELLITYAPQCPFLVPDATLAEVREHLPAILERRAIPADPALAVLDGLCRLLEVIESDIYSPFEIPARARLAGRDEQDWPVLAVALCLKCPVWTEDTDFFGIGIPTWTTGHVEIFLSTLTKPM